MALMPCFGSHYFFIFGPNKFEWHSSSRLRAAKAFSKGDTQSTKGDTQSKAFSQLNTCEHKSMENEIDKTKQELKQLLGKTSFHERWTKCQLVGRAVRFCVFNQTSSSKKVNHIPVIWGKTEKSEKEQSRMNIITKTIKPCLRSTMWREENQVIQSEKTHNGHTWVLKRR